MEKITYDVSRVIGDRIKIDVLLILRYSFGLNDEHIEKIYDCGRRLGFPEDYVEFVPTYSFLLTCLQASSSVLLKKLDELEYDGLIYSVREPERHNRRIFYLTPLGEKISDSLMEIDVLIKDSLSESPP